jgi:hypothetical protein
VVAIATAKAACRLPIKGSMPFGNASAGGGFTLWSLCGTPREARHSRM